MSATAIAHEKFTRAALGEDGQYPNHTAFVANDSPGWDQSAWQTLVEGRPTVVIDGDGSEILYLPRQHHQLGRWVNRQRGKITVEIYWRSDGRTIRLAEGLVDRRDIGRQRELVPAG